MIGFWWFETHLRRGLPKGEFSQVASSGGMTPHCESECSAKTKLSTGSSSPALATHTALRGKKGHGVYHTSLHWGGWRQEDGEGERRRWGQGRGDKWHRAGERRQEKERVERQKEMRWTKGMERLFAGSVVDLPGLRCWKVRCQIQTMPWDGCILLEASILSRGYLTNLGQSLITTQVILCSVVVDPLKSKKIPQSHVALQCCSPVPWKVTLKYPGFHLPFALLFQFVISHFLVESENKIIEIKETTEGNKS